MIFQASLANAQILIPSNQASVSSMLLEGRTLLALATTMYAPGGIDQVLICVQQIVDAFWEEFSRGAENSKERIDKNKHTNTVVVLAI